MNYNPHVCTTNSGVYELVIVYVSIFEECLVAVLSGWQSNLFCSFFCVKSLKKWKGVGRKGLKIRDTYEWLNDFVTFTLWNNHKFFRINVDFCSGYYLLWNMKYLVSSVIAIIFNSQGHQKHFGKEFGIRNTVSYNISLGNITRYTIPNLSWHVTRDTWHP